MTAQCGVTYDMTLFDQVEYASENSSDGRVHLTRRPGNDSTAQRVSKSMWVIRYADVAACVPEYPRQLQMV